MDADTVGRNVYWKICPTPIPLRGPADDGEIRACRHISEADAANTKLGTDTPMMATKIVRKSIQRPRCRAGQDTKDRVQGSDLLPRPADPNCKEAGKRSEMI